MTQADPHHGPDARPLQLHLYGDMRVQSPTGTALALRGRAAALVALVVLEPDMHRERAAAMLWPDAANPRQNLRQQLLRFRHALGTALLVGDEYLRLAAGVVCLPAAPGAELLPAEPAGGDTLGVWLTRQREALQRAQREPLARALADAEAAGDLNAALSHASAMLALEPFAESAYAGLMRAHYLRGEWSQGLAVFQRLRAMLATGCGAAPDVVSADLAESLRRAGQGALARRGPNAALPVVLQRPPVLAGRHREWDAVQQAWRENRVALLEGEAGLGKSRLIAELLAGRVALVGAGRPGDRGAPYATLARLLRPWLSQGAAELPLHLHPARAHLAPEFAQSTAAQPLRLNALIDLVTDILVRHHLTTVVLDDLHFADDATLELLAGLAASADPSRHWLFAQRPAEATAAAHSLKDALLEQQRLNTITLQTLDEPATAALIDALALPGLSGQALAAAALRHTGGNPLYLLETLKQGLADGSLARGEWPRPASVGALIERRLLRLSEPALVLARVVAIAGVDFCIELAEAAIGQRAVQLSSAWTELQQAQVLRDEAFAHDLVSDAVLRSVPQVVARRVHAQCAAWLSDHGGEPARVARHWQQGGRPAEAAAAFELAAQRAGQASRRHEQASLYEQAARAYADAGQTEARFEALTSRVAALNLARVDQAALAEAEALHAQAGTEMQRLRATRVWADLLAQHGQGQRAAEIGIPGLALAQRLGAHDEQVRLAGVLVHALCPIGRAEEAYGLMLPLRAWVDQSSDDELRHLWYGYWAATLGHIGRLREAVTSYDVAIACAERTGRRDSVGSTLLNLTVVLRTMGQFGRALETSRRGLSLMSDDPEATSSRTLARLMHARDLAETGHHGPALRMFEDLLPPLQAMGSPFWTLAAETSLASLWLHLGQYARALQLLQTADEATPPWMRAGRRLLRMEIAQAMGQPLPMAEVMQARELTAGDVYRESGIAVRALRAVDAEQVLAQAPHWAEVARSHERFGVLLAVQVFEARAATALQRPAQAATAARAALDLLDEGYSPEAMYLPELHLVAWQALRAAGAPAEAQAALSAGARWVRQTALPQVPAPFIDSFLHRNPVNCALLAAASGSG